MRAKHPSQTYHKVLEGLPRGPKVKKQETIDLENIVLAFLDPTKKVSCEFNSLGELEVGVDDHIYNLSLILKHVPDFDHLAISQQDISNYENFLIKEATFKPILRGKTVPPKSDYKSLDPTGLHDHLEYGEKLAITLYTGENYGTINEFLRKSGQLKSLKEKSQGELTKLVKELILVSAMASHGLNKIPEREVNLEGNIENLYRYEITVDELNKNREGDITDQKLTMQPGFTSTTQLEKTVLEFNEQIKTTGEKGTVVIIEQPKSNTAIGKNVKELSEYGKEGEVLFAPNTQLKYYYKGKDDELDVFIGVPVRTPVKSKNLLYSSGATSLRSEIIKLCQNDNAKNYSINELKIIRSILKNEKVKDTSLLIPALKEIDILIAKKEWLATKPFFLEAAEYVYNEHLSKPYEDILHFPYDYEANFGKDIVHRSNHGLDHTVRVALHLDAVIDYYAKFANDKKFQKYAQSLTAKEKELISLALLFFVTGRESEAGFKDDLSMLSKYTKKSAHNTYREASFENFKKYALSKDYAKKDIERFYDIIVTDRKYYDEMGKAQSDNQYLFNIMIHAHRLDLMRCFDATDVSQIIEDSDKKLALTSPLQNDASNQLLALARDAIINTGDRLISTFDGTKMIDASQNYNEELFIRSSKNPEVCVDLCLSNFFRHDENLSKRSIDLQKYTKTELLNALFIAARGGHLVLLERLIAQAKIMTIDLNQTVEHFSLLHVAAEKGHADVVKLLLQNGANPNQSNEIGTTPLHLAAAEGHSNIINVLIDHKAVPNVTETVDEHLTPLLLAVDHNHPDAIRTLIKRGANPNQADSKGDTVLHRAVKKGQIDPIKVLLSHGADIFQKDNLDLSALQLIAFVSDFSNRLKIISEICKAKDLMVLINKLNPKDPLDQNVLKSFAFYAVENDNKEALLALIEKGIDVKKEFFNQSLIHSALLSGSQNSTEILLKNGIGINDLIEPYKATVLHLAIAYKRPEIVNLLLELKADYTIKDPDNRSAIDMALKLGDPDILKIFLERKILNLNETYLTVFPLEMMFINDKIDAALFLITQGAPVNSYTRTPLLHLSIMTSRYQLFEALLSRSDIDLNVIDPPMSALSLAASIQSAFCVTQLLDKKADPNQRDTDNKVPLYYAVMEQNIQIIRLLIDKGADPLIKIKSNTTPLLLAADLIAKNCLNAMTEDHRLSQLVNRIRPNDPHIPILLNIAIERGDDIAIEGLLKIKADLTQRDTRDVTPLEKIINKSTPESFRKIISSKFLDINLVDEKGNRLIDYAVSENKPELLKILLNNNAEMLKPSSSGDLPLANAISKNSVEMVRMLVEAGAPILSTTESAFSPLHWAVRSGSVEIMDYLISKGADLNKLGIESKTPLELAVDLNDKEKVEALIKHGAKIQKQVIESLQTRNNAPLYFSLISKIPTSELNFYLNKIISTRLFNDLFCYGIQEKNDRIFEMLLEKGANAATADSKHKTAFQHALESENLSFVDKLLTKDNVNSKMGASIQPLEFAVGKGDLPLIKLLLERGADLHLVTSDLVLTAGFKGYADVFKYFLETESICQVFPLRSDRAEAILSKASIYDYPGVIDVLLKNKLIKIDEKITSDDGTALQLAAEYKHAKVAQVLLSNGADPNSENDVGMTPLMFAACHDHGNEELVKVLISNGADIHRKDKKSGRDALIFAAKTDNPDIVSYLLKSGANPATADAKKGMTALHYAAEAGIPETIKMLAESNKTIINQTDKVLRTPLHYVIISRNIAACETLLAIKPELNVKDVEGNTPLHLAVRNKLLSHAELLLNSGADPYQLNEDHLTPLHLAYEKQDIDLLNKMLQLGVDPSRCDLVDELIDFSIHQVEHSLMIYTLLAINDINKLSSKSKDLLFADTQSITEDFTKILDKLSPDEKLLFWKKANHSAFKAILTEPVPASSAVSFKLFEEKKVIPKNIAEFILKQYPELQSAAKLDLNKS